MVKFVDMYVCRQIDYNVFVLHFWQLNDRHSQSTTKRSQLSTTILKRDDRLLCQINFVFQMVLILYADISELRSIVPVSVTIVVRGIYDYKLLFWS